MNFQRLKLGGIIENEVISSIFIIIILIFKS